MCNYLAIKQAFSFLCLITFKIPFFFFLLAHFWCWSAVFIIHIYHDFLVFFRNRSIL
jgi:hypothetical protein